MYEATIAILCSLCLIVLSADNHGKQFGPRSGLTFWIQTVWHSDGIPERINFEIKQQMI